MILFYLREATSISRATAYTRLRSHRGQGGSLRLCALTAGAAHTPPSLHPLNLNRLLSVWMRYPVATRDIRIGGSIAKLFHRVSTFVPQV